MPVSATATQNEVVLSNGRVVGWPDDWTGAVALHDCIAVTLARDPYRRPWFNDPSRWTFRYGAPAFRVVWWGTLLASLVLACTLAAPSISVAQFAWARGDIGFALLAASFACLGGFFALVCLRSSWRTRCAWRSALARPAFFHQASKP